MCLILWRIKSLSKAIASSISNTYTLCIIFYIIAFVVAFSGISNFGILVRERVMILPFFLMLIAYLGPSIDSENKTKEIIIK